MGAVGALVPHLRYTLLAHGLSFMNAEFVTVGIQDNRCPAAGRLERRKGERHLVTSGMLYRLVEVIRFQRQVGTVARWLQEGFVSDSERVRTDLILDPELVAVIDASRADEPENILIEGPGTRKIRGWVYDEGKFDDSHW